MSPLFPTRGQRGGRDGGCEALPLGEALAVVCAIAAGSAAGLGAMCQNSDDISAAVRRGTRRISR